jgi:hypothetical protein
MAGQFFSPKMPHHKHLKGTRAGLKPIYLVHRMESVNNALHAAEVI